MYMAIQWVEMRVGLQRVGNLAGYLPQKGHKSHLPPRHYLHHLNEDRKRRFISLCCIIIIITIGLINAIVVPLEAFI